MFENYLVYLGEVIELKLKQKVPPVTVIEIEEALFNMEARPIIDDRARNRTIPPTVWFISETNEGRVLKVVGIFRPIDKIFVVKTAYEPDQMEIDHYEANNR